MAFAIGLASPLALSSQAASRDSLARADTGRLEGVLVRAIRGGVRAPIAERTLDRATILARHLGQEAPLLLQGAVPSVTAHTETGTAWGYSYLRLRGMDQTRINITLDGVPLNDPEDQVLYFANFADLMSSVQSIQVQRGVGTSSAGTASFAGSVNIETMPLATAGAGGDGQVQVGSWGARRMSAAFHTGLRPSRLAAYGRVGTVRTDGYRRHSGVDGRSALLGAGWFGDRDLVKLTLLAGRFADTLSYVGATRSELAADRRFNPLDPSERDRFTQQMVALSHTRILSPASAWSTTLYRNSAEGSYDYFALPDRYRYNLQHWWYGVTSAWSTTRGTWQWHVGVNANTYARDHRAYLEPATQFYDNTGHKDDVSAFAKASVGSGRVRWFGDLQARWARFAYTPDPGAGIGGRSQVWTFLNPKVGVTAALRPGVSAFVSLGRASREPARNDLLAGEDDLNAGNVQLLGDFGRVRPEEVTDLESGVTRSSARGHLTAGLYAMQFRNDIARIGAPTASGLVLRRNVGASVRRGVEVDASHRLHERLVVGGNASWAHHRLRSFTDSSSGTPETRRNVAPLLSPVWTSTQSMRATLRDGVDLSWEGRYQSRAFLDNTGRADRRLPGFYVMDLSLHLRHRDWSVALRGTNIGAHEGFGSGAVGSDGVARFFVLPARAVFVTMGRQWSGATR
ncbi:MAG: TonB-dependent receptor plug domain-containing protein [Gemmatimonadetes bacterium]|nr:TonB-dependent receptor plug domain-containing protein [Gemmatimonadota bacterium]